MNPVDDPPEGGDFIGDAFEQRCVDAALDSHAVWRMRDAEKRLRELVPLPAGQYVAGLGRMAKVDTGRILASAGLAGSAVEPESASRWGRLLKALELPIERARIILRASLAEQLGFGLVIQRAAAYRGGHGTPDAETSAMAALGEIESEYSEEWSRKLTGILDALDACYSRAD